MVLKVKELNHFLGFLACLDFCIARGRGEQQVLPEAALALGVSADQQVVQHRGMLKQFDVLKRAGNAQPCHRLRQLLGQPDQALRSQVIDLARGGRVDAADQVEHGCLACAIGPDQGEDLARLDIKADLVDRQHPAKAHAQIVGGQKRGGGLDRRRAAPSWEGPLGGQRRTRSDKRGGDHLNRSDFWKDFCRLNMPLR